MAIVTNVYKKRFSKIENMQSSEDIHYNLIELDSSDIKVYGVELISYRGEEQDRLVLENISESKICAMNIITYLYENAIKPEIALGIVNDIMVSEK